MQRLLGCFFLLLALSAPMSVAAQQAAADPKDKSATRTIPDAVDDPEAARIQRINRAFALVQQRKFDDAISLLDQNIVEYDMAYGNDRNTYCADGPAQTLILMTTLKAADKKAGVKRSITAVGLGWCRSMWLKAYTLVEKGELDAAVPLLERAIDRAPLNPQYLCELGYVKARTGDPAASLDLYQRAEAVTALSGETDNHWKAKAMFGEGYALIDLQRWDEAEAKLKALLKLDPSYDKARSELDYIAQQRGKKSDTY